MPPWLGVLLAVAGGFTTIVAFFAAIRGVIKWARAAVAHILDLLEKIEAASKGFEELNRRLHELAGSILQLVVPLIGRQEAHDERLATLATRLDEFTERLDTYAELYTDITAALARLRRPDQ